MGNITRGCLLGFLLALIYCTSALAVYAENPVVSDPSDQVNVSISGQTVVWQDYRNKTYGCPDARNCISADIYARNLATGVEQRLSTASNAMDPDIDGKLVVWRNWSTGKIIVHDLSTGLQQNASIQGGTVQMVTPAISGQIVVWVDYRNSNEYGDIYMRDLTQAADVPVNVASSDPTIPVQVKDKRNPDIDGNIIVWEDWTNAYQDQGGWWRNPDIYMMDLSTGVVQPVTTNDSDQYSPVVSGNRVFWQDFRNNNWDIYMKDLTTGLETRVTNNIAHQSWPAADGDLLTWKDTRNGNEDIYIKNLLTGVEMPVTTDPSAQKIPVVSGSTLAWIDKRNSNWDVFTAEFDMVPPQIDSVFPSEWQNNSSTTIGATYSDIGDGVDPGSVQVKVEGGSLTTCTAGAGQVDCPVTGVPDGIYTITVDLMDAAGNAASTATSDLMVDTTGPAIGPLVVDKEPDSDTAIISAGLDDPDPGIGIDTASVFMKVNGNTLTGCSVSANLISCSISGLAFGQQQVEVNAADRLGNTSTFNGSFETLDTVAPEITNTLPSGNLTAAQADISADFSDPYPGSGIIASSVAVTLDGSQLSECTVAVSGVSCHVTGLSDSSHQVSVTVNDGSGNTATSNWSFSVNADGPVIDNLTPASGATVNNPWTPVTADIKDNGGGVDPTSIRIYLDGEDVTGSSTYNGGGIQFEMVSGVDAGLTQQTHSAKVVATDLLGRQSDMVWSFDVTSPELKLFHMKTYWPSYAAYTQGYLMVDYRMANPGTGTCRAGEIVAASASSGVIVVGPVPFALGDIAAKSYADYSFSYIIPAGVSSFRAVSHATCTDDGGNIYQYAGPPPQ